MLGGWGGAKLTNEFPNRLNQEPCMEAGTLPKKELTLFLPLTTRTTPHLTRRTGLPLQILAWGDMSPHPYRGGGKAGLQKDCHRGTGGDKEGFIPIGRFESLTTRVKAQRNTLILEILVHISRKVGRNVDKIYEK